MKYSVLGPLSVTIDGREVAITAGRDRVVLAMLLLNAGRIVSTVDLIDAVWEEAPPATARGQLQTCVSRLRRALPDNTIQTYPEGYAIRLGDNDLDVAVFNRRVAEARVTADPETARRLFREALDLWRGRAVMGVESALIRQVAAVLDEQYAVAIEDWVDLELAQGRERDLLADLTGLVERFPVRERLRSQLMLALCRVGRQADALHEYQRAADLLREELGIEPGPQLRDLWQRILASESDEPATAGIGGGQIRSLPRTVGDFTGRTDTVGRLLKVVEQNEPGPVVLLIDGMAGSGKTTVALHIANAVGGRYPDAQLFIDLHGHSTRQPVDPSEALLTLLRQLGVRAERIPAELTERVTLWRNELSTRRVLVVFDNAASSAQLAELLPASAGSLALVTGRRRLTGLDGACPESLPVLAEDEAVTLLARIVGDRVSADYPTATEIVRRCGYLPLAIRLAGARLAHRPGWRLADLLRRLGSAALPQLSAEDRSVADAFGLSFRQLPPPAQRTFRLLGCYPGRWFDALTVAALTGAPIETAEDLVDDLVDVHLIEEPEPRVFRLHDLLREYAARLAQDLLPDERRTAVVGALDLELHALVATTPAVERELMMRDMGRMTPLRPDLVALAHPAARTERVGRGLAPLQDAAVAVGRPEYAWWLPRAAWRLLWSHGYFDTVADLQERALRAAEATGDRFGMAMSANYLASAHFRRARYHEACALLEASLQLWRELGEVAAMARTMSNLASVLEAAGRYVEAVDMGLGSLAVVRRRASAYELALGHGSFAPSLQRLGRYAEGLWHLRLQLFLAIELDDRISIANCFLDIVSNRRRAGTIEPAAAHRRLRAALALFRARGYDFGEAQSRDELADLLRSEGRLTEALAEHRLALVVIRRQGDRSFEAAFLNGLGRTLLACGDTDEAGRSYSQALALAQGIPQPYEIGRACAGLGDCLAVADPDRAREHWRSALRIFTELAVPERFEMESRLVR